jgi:hypothetical protein
MQTSKGSRTCNTSPSVGANTRLLLTDLAPRAPSLSFRAFAGILIRSRIATRYLAHDILSPIAWVG